MTQDKFKDSMGRYLTQSLFIEQAYDVNTAIYTLKNDDFVYKGKSFPSLKKLYLEMEDPIEYEFANKYLAGWDQWERICENKLYTGLINRWRKELELKLRSIGFKEMANKASTSPMAARWLSDKGWDEGKSKRPTKAEKEADKNTQKQISDIYENDLARLKVV